MGNNMKIKELIKKQIIRLLIISLIVNVFSGIIIVNSVKAQDTLPEYRIDTENYSNYAFLGDTVILNVYVEDEEGNEIDNNSTFSFKWYKKMNNETREVLGEKNTYIINSVTESDFYNDDYDTEYVCELYVDNQYVDEVSMAIYNAEECFGGCYSEKEIFSGSSLKLEAEVYDREDDYKVNLEYFENNEFSFKWYKQKYYINTDTTTKSNVLSTDYIYNVMNISEDDFSNDSVITSYDYEIYFKGRKVATGKYQIYEKKLENVENLKVAGYDIVKDSVVITNNINGLTYNKENNTLTLTNFNGSTSEKNIISADGSLNIILNGTNKLASEGDIWEGIYVRGYLNLSGNGKLDIDLSKSKNSGATGIMSLERLMIDGCNLNIIGNTTNTGFYGMELLPWSNDSDESNGEECYIKINNATVNINNVLEENNKECYNVGIDAQDADLIVINSNINISLTYGNIYGMVAGLYSYERNKIYGGKLSIDKKSEVNIEANAGNEIYTTYFYQDDIAAQNIFAGYDILKNESVRENILHYEYVIERYECKYPYLEFTNHNWKNLITKATTLQDGMIIRKCIDCEKISFDKKIDKIADVELLNDSYIYTGQEIKPVVTVRDSKGNTISKNNYEVSYRDNIDVGNGIVMIEFKGDYYSGTITKTFRIEENQVKNNVPTNSNNITTTKNINNNVDVKKVKKPKKVLISNLEKKKHKMIVNWKAQRGVDGYQIQYSTNKKFTKKLKNKNVNGFVKEKMIIKGLKKNKLYYVRVRAYKKNGNETVYGPWSKIKKIKINK